MAYRKQLANGNRRIASGGVFRFLVIAALVIEAALVSIPAGNAAMSASLKETVLYSFGVDAADGAYPAAGLTPDPSGVFYGTTEFGGYESGTVFELTPPLMPGGSWDEKVIYSFGITGANPTAGVVRGETGVLYGTTPIGFSNTTGVVYSLTPPVEAGGQWAATDILDSGLLGDGLFNPAFVTIGPQGVLYGTSSYFGANPCSDFFGCGFIFTLTPSDQSRREYTSSTIYTFTGGADGSNPLAGLLGRKNGILYGTSSTGGSLGQGTVFALAPPIIAGGESEYRVLHSFGASGDGATPMGTLAGDVSGRLYGTTSAGGTAGLGTVFMLTPPPLPGRAWSERVLHSFLGGADGSTPVANVVVMDGTIYGTTKEGGTSGAGTVFALRPPAQLDGIWAEKVLHSFTGGTDGSTPLAGVIASKYGLLGTTSMGGQFDGGTIYSIAP